MSDQQQDKDAATEVVADEGHTAKVRVDQAPMRPSFMDPSSDLCLMMTFGDGGMMGFFHAVREPDSEDGGVVYSAKTDVVPRAAFLGWSDGNAFVHAVCPVTQVQDVPAEVADGGPSGE